MQVEHDAGGVRGMQAVALGAAALVLELPRLRGGERLFLFAQALLQLRAVRGGLVTLGAQGLQLFLEAVDAQLRGRARSGEFGELRVVLHGCIPQAQQLGIQGAGALLRGGALREQLAGGLGIAAALQLRQFSSRTFGAALGAPAVPG